MSWAALEMGAPELAAAGRRLLYRDPIGQGLLATVLGDAPPRIHPVYVAIDGGRLLTFINPSAKMADVERDGRYALHAHVDPLAPSEFMVRGRAVPIDGDLRRQIAAGWYFTTDERYRLFELTVESALRGRRDDPDAWPPIYQHWAASTI